MGRVSKADLARVRNSKAYHSRNLKKMPGEATGSTNCEADDTNCHVYKPPQHVTASSIVAAMKRQQKYGPSSTVTETLWQGKVEGFKGRAELGPSYEDKQQGDLKATASCFVCRSNPGLKMSDLKSLPSMEHYIFFLYELLEISINSTNAYLKKLDKPEDWIRLCETCQSLIVKGRAARQQITELEGKLRQCKKTILQKMKGATNYLPNASKNVKKTGSIQGLNELGILQRVQNFVCTKVYHTISAFGGGGINLARIDHPKQTDADKPLSSQLDDGDDGVYNDTAPARSPSPIPSTSSSFEALNKPDFQGDEGILESGETGISRKRSNPDSKIVVLNIKKRSLDFDSSPAQRIHSQSIFKSTVYDCPNCPQIKGYSAIKYAQHLDIHLKMPFQCSKCLEFFPADSDLQEKHWKEKHTGKESNNASTYGSSDAPNFIKIKFDPGRIWKCDKCFQGFFTMEERNEHELFCTSCDISTGELKPRPSKLQSYPCTLCSALLRNFPEWRIHRVIHHPEVDRMCCYYCDQSFCEKTVEGVEARHDTQMYKHMGREHKDFKFGTIVKIYQECSSCGLVFNWESEHRKHLLKKHGISEVDSNRCEICHKTYSLAKHLRKHMSIHHFQSEVSICDVCGLKFIEKKQLAHHKIIQHGIDPDPEEGFKMLICPKDGCDYRTIDQQKLGFHIKMNHEKRTRPFSCNLCGKKFTDASKLRTHQQIHKNKESKPYQCEICGNSFAVRNYLYIHKRLSHEGRTFPSTNKKKAPRRLTRTKKGAATMAVVQDSGGQAKSNESPQDFPEAFTEDQHGVGVNVAPETYPVQSQPIGAGESQAQGEIEILYIGFLPQEPNS